MKTYPIDTGVKMLEAIERGDLKGKPPQGGNPGRRVWHDDVNGWQGGATGIEPPPGAVVFYWVGTQTAWRRFSGKGAA